MLGKKGPDEPTDHALGRSRDGLTIKIHMLCDANGIPLRFLLSGGQASDISYATHCWTMSAFHGASVAVCVNAAVGACYQRLRRRSSAPRLRPVIPMRSMRRKP